MSPGRRARIEREKADAGTAELNKVIDKIESERPGQVAKKVQEFLDHRSGEKKVWETEGQGIGPEGEQLTLEDLIYLKPFTMEDMNATVAFRVNDKVMRSTQRLREQAGRAYDIVSDLYRDAYVIGLLVLSERYKSILGLEIVISRAESYQQTMEDARDTVLRFKEALKPLTKEVRKIRFHEFMDSLDQRPKWNQEIHLEELRNDRMLNELLQELEDSD